MILLTRAVILAAIKIELVLRRLARIDSDHKPPSTHYHQGGPPSKHDRLYVGIGSYMHSSLIKTVWHNSLVDI